MYHIIVSQVVYSRRDNIIWVCLVPMSIMVECETCLRFVITSGQKKPLTTKTKVTERKNYNVP